MCKHKKALSARLEEFIKKKKKNNKRPKNNHNKTPSENAYERKVLSYGKTDKVYHVPH